MSDDAWDERELRAIRDEAVAIAEEAGRLVLGGWRAGAAIHKKGAVDLVTDFDVRSEALIRERLARAFPAHPIVGEEGEAPPDATEGPAWYVDPIDGTTNFAHGHPFFAVALGFATPGARLVGVVHAPALGLTWASARGAGASRNGEPARVSRTATLDDALVATGFPYDRRTSEDDNLAEVAAMLKRTQGIRRCGAAALDLAHVADGTYDLFWEQTLGPWDMCAGAALIEEAGGRVTGYGGEPLDLRAGHVVATNGALHGAAQALLAEARRDKPPPRTRR